MSLRVRSARHDELPGLARIAVERQIAAHGSPEFGLEQLQEDPEGPGLRRLVAVDGDVLLGWGMLEMDTVILWIPPSDTRAAPALLATLLGEAHAQGLTEVVGLVWEPDPAASHRLEQAGFVRASEALRMSVRLDGPSSPPVWPAGVSVRTSTPDDPPAIHALLVEAFAGEGESIAPFEAWLPWMTDDPSFDPRAWFLAEAGAELAGIALCWKEGFVKDLAVAPRFRGRGIGEALLRHLFLEFRGRGVAEVALKVDAANPTGAVRLYERVGMRAGRRYELWRREL